MGYCVGPAGGSIVPPAGGTGIVINKKLSKGKKKKNNTQEILNQARIQHLRYIIPIDEQDLEKYKKDLFCRFFLRKKIKQLAKNLDEKKKELADLEFQSNEEIQKVMKELDKEYPGIKA